MINGVSQGVKSTTATWGNAGRLEIGGGAAGGGFLGEMQHVMVVNDWVDDATLRALYSILLVNGPDVLIPARAKTVEQGSKDEIAQCVFAILNTVPGQRTDDPGWGFPDQTFRQGGVDLNELRRVVEEHEPRASVLTDSEFEGLVQRVRVKLS